MATKTPVLFIGHGNPMNALADNDYTRTLRRLGTRWPHPKAVLCVSAHWMTDGLCVTHMKVPRTIHDFYGFPAELFAVRYPAPGDPALAERVQDLVRTAPVQRDEDDWGLDHGAWSVLTHLFPNADVPVVQLSLDVRRAGDFHYRLGEELAPLREENVLIVASGNIVHNLRRLRWEDDAPPHEWNLRFDAHVKAVTESGDRRALLGDPGEMPGGALSVPTPDHWQPYLIALGAAQGDPVRWEYEGLEHASLSMRSASFGASKKD
jgi:4,5-DOPA dioxygenase extradiol